MTDRVFWREPYLTELQAVVSAVQGDVVNLDRTIFYAFSGGQESDAGTIGGRPVLDARLDGDEISYTLPADHGLAVGTPVAVAIDWHRRFRLMRLHFAAELLLEIVTAGLPQARKIGAHIAADKARIDFLCDAPITDRLPEWGAQALAIVRADLPIVSAFSDAAAGRRYWEIAGYARVPCGGTHLRRTSEVGDVTLKRRNVGRGKERIEIFLADPA
jgi:Ser-tRNA(Ala) deacylase AlaX